MRAHHPPILHTTRPEGAPRKVLWLELFSDLVYVAAVVQLGDLLANDVTWDGAARAFVLFAVLWSSWSGLAHYLNRFVVDDTTHRLLVLGQIFAVANLAIVAAYAFDDDSANVALTFVIVRLFLLALYVRTWHHVPEARPLVRHHLQWIGASTAFVAVAVFVDGDARTLAWAAAFGVVVAGTMAPRSKAMWEQFPHDHKHLAERYALLTMIVLGESFIKVIPAVVSNGIEVDEEVLAGLGFALVAAVWWTYFDRVADHASPREIARERRWVYLHLPLMACITALGVGTKKVVESDLGEPAQTAYVVLLGGAVAIILLSLTGLLRSLDDLAGARRRMLAAATVLALTVAGSWLPIGLLVAALFATLVACLVPEEVEMRRGI